MDDSIKPWDILKWVVVGILGLAILVTAIFGLFAGISAFGRYQKVADAENQVQVNNIVIAQTDQLVQVEKQKAQIRIADAQGIATSQTIIAGSLTPAYLEYLAIQAQQIAASSSDHTSTIYIPVGPQGIPIIASQPVGGK